MLGIFTLSFSQEITWLKRYELRKCWFFQIFAKDVKCFKAERNLLDVSRVKGHIVKSFQNICPSTIYILIT